MRIKNIKLSQFKKKKRKDNLPVSYHYYSYQKIYLKKSEKWINRPTFTYRNTATYPFEGVEYYREFLPYRGNIASIYLNGHRLVKFHNQLHLFIFEKFLVNLEIALDTLPVNDKERKKKNEEALSLWYDHTVCFHHETWPEDFENWKGIYFHARAKNIHLSCKYREEITLLIDAVKKIRNKLGIGSLFLPPNPDLAYNDYATKETWQNIYSFTTEDILGIPFIAEEEFRTRNFSQNELYVVHFPALITYIDEMYDNLMKVKDLLPTNDEWSLMFLLGKRLSLKKESLGSYWYHFKSHLKERGNKKNFILGTTKRIAVIIALTFLRPIIYPIYFFLLWKKKNKGWRVSFPTLKAYLLDKWYKYQSFNIERDIYHITNRLKSGLFNIFVAFPIRVFMIRYFDPSFFLSIQLDKNLKDEEITYKDEEIIIYKYLEITYKDIETTYKDLKIQKMISPISKNLEHLYFKFLQQKSQELELLTKVLAQKYEFLGIFPGYLSDIKGSFNPQKVLSLSEKNSFERIVEMSTFRGKFEFADDWVIYHRVRWLLRVHIKEFYPIANILSTGTYCIRPYWGSIFLEPWSFYGEKKNPDFVIEYLHQKLNRNIALGVYLRTRPYEPGMEWNDLIPFRSGTNMFKRLPPHEEWITKMVIKDNSRPWGGGKTLFIIDKYRGFLKIALGRTLESTIRTLEEGLAADRVKDN